MSERISPTHWEGFHVRDLTIAKVLRRQAELRGDAICLHNVENDRRYSYAEVDALTDRMGNGLLALGLRQGDHVAMMVESSAECLFTNFAIGKIGCVSVPINTGSRGQLLTYLLTAADVVAIVADPVCASRLMDCIDDLPQLRNLIIMDERAKPLPVPPHISVVPHHRLENGASHSPGIDVAFDDPAFIMYTSGTTGPSKGNVFVHATTFMWEQSSPRLCNMDERDIFYFCVSMGHVAGLFGIAYLMVALGGTIALSTKFSASRFFGDVRKSGATLAMTIGAMGNFIENQPPTTDDRNHNLRVLLGGPLPKDPQAFQVRFGVHLSQGYGLSDHSSFIKFTPGESPEKLGSIGKVVEPFEVLIVDERDCEVAVGVIGEIVVRSRYPWRCSSGYYKRPAESMEARRNDWFHTGDRGYLDIDGFYWFVDRAKDSIRRRGENISAFEVERVLLSHPAVAEAAAYPVNADSNEDELAVSLVLREGKSLDIPDFIRFCANNLAIFMVPRFVAIVESLPKTPTQRVEKYKLKAWANENRDSFWDREAMMPSVKG